MWYCDDQHTVDPTTASTAIASATVDATQDMQLDANTSQPSTSWTKNPLLDYEHYRDTTTKPYNTHLDTR